MKNKYSDEKNIIILRNHITADKDYLYSLENVDKKIKIFILPQKLYELNIQLETIHVIAVESYLSLDFIFNWFIHFNVPINYDLHDYHCVWYETHFVHKDHLLTKHELENSILKYAFRKITFDQWHSVWFSFLNHVNVITAFSESSKEIFYEYYPEYVDKVKVVPHSLDYISCEKINIISSKFNVGIFGNIQGIDKGCGIVKSFLEFSKNNDYEIFLNGDLSNDFKVFSNNIHYMGRYKVDDLDKIIERQEISVVFFPSICPETFSYTISELMHVGIPVACFNVGAQAEKISKYNLGCIIDDYDNKSILKGLTEAYNKGQNEYNE